MLNTHHHCPLSMSLVPYRNPVPVEYELHVPLSLQPLVRTSRFCLSVNWLFSIPHGSAVTQHLSPCLSRLIIPLPECPSLEGSNEPVIPCTRLPTCSFLHGGFSYLPSSGCIKTLLMSPSRAVFFPLFTHVLALGPFVHILPALVPHLLLGP